MLNFYEIGNFIGILDRVRMISGLRKDKEIAVELGLSPQALSDLKGVATGKLERKLYLPFRQLNEWACKKEISLDWLFTGSHTAPAELSTDPPTSPEVSALLAKTRTVLEAGHPKNSAILAGIIETYFDIVAGDSASRTIGRGEGDAPKEAGQVGATSGPGERTVRAVR